MSENLIFRLFQPGDMKGILQLWGEESGWGEITEEQFERWTYTPFGECLISVAVDKYGTILGQQVFMPAKLYLSGGEVKACRVLAPILSKKIRENIRQKTHPFYEMHRVCLEAAKSNGWSVVYTYPVHAWITVMKLFPKAGLPKMEIAEYECWSLPKEKISMRATTDSGFEAYFTNEVTEESNELWESAKLNFPIVCGIARDSERLRWKLAIHLVFAVRDGDNKLAGYVAINKKTGLVVDMLASSPGKLQAVFAAALKAFARYETETGEFAFKGIGMMKTELVAQLIEVFGFEKTDFKFAFGCYSADPSIATESILPGNWYNMPDD